MSEKERRQFDSVKVLNHVVFHHIQIPVSVTHTKQHLPPKKWHSWAPSNQKTLIYYY